MGATDADDHGREPPPPPDPDAGLLILLALLSSFTPLSIDMYLPALPVIAVDLKARRATSSSPCRPS